MKSNESDLNRKKQNNNALTSCEIIAESAVGYVPTQTFPGSAAGPWARYVHDADANGLGLVRFPRLAAKDDECARKLAKRTLTNLYNERPTWLDLAHRQLDAAVFAAYGWQPDLSDEAILAALLVLNQQRTARAAK